MGLIGKQQAAALLCAFLLAACGGGGGDEAPASSSSAASSASSSSASSRFSSSSSRSSSSSTGSSSRSSSSSSTSSSSSSSSAASGLVALDASTSCGLSDFRAELLAAINQARATARTCGTESKPAVAALVWEDRLFSAAARHSQDMAANNYFSHDSLDGRKPGQRVSAEGYTWRSVGENIAAGYSTVAEVMQVWMNSPGHCNNIMSADKTEVGVSCVRATGAQFSTYWTMNLGRR